MGDRVKERVKQFYNVNPFPNYELSNFNTKRDLLFSAYDFAKILDRSIPESASVIDIGTGTGQLSAFLSLRRKCVLGIDFSEASLKKARALKNKLKLNSLSLEKIDILDLNQINSIKTKFDYLLCFGVLHHTQEPYQAFKNILKLVKPGGYIAIGLYNKVSRAPFKLAAFMLRGVFINNQSLKDGFMRLQIGSLKDKDRVNGWWNDQYMHPHETTHTVGEILWWFRKNNIKYYHTIPSLSLFDQNNLECSGVWNNNGNKLYPYFFIRIFKQFSWIWKTRYEGGYWITFGRKISD